MSNPVPAFPDTGSLIGDVQEAGTDELVAAFASAGLETLPVVRAIAKATGIFLHTGAKYAAVINRDDEHREHAAKSREISPIREFIARGISAGELRTHLPGHALFEMCSALIGRAQILTITDRVTPEHLGHRRCRGVQGAVDLALDASPAEVVK